MKILPKRFNFCTGVAWLSSVRVVICLVKSFNERNLYLLLIEKLQKPPVRNGRKVEMTSSPYGPYELGYTHVTKA
jgi:hypothetical protein